MEDVVKNKTIIPRADDIFEASDHAYFVAERGAGVDKVLALSGKKQYNIKDLMISEGVKLTTIELDEGEKIPNDLKNFDDQWVYNSIN